MHAYSILRYLENAVANSTSQLVQVFEYIPHTSEGGPVGTIKLLVIPCAERTIRPPASGLGRGPGPKREGPGQGARAEEF